MDIESNVVHSYLPTFIGIIGFLSVLYGVVRYILEFIDLLGRVGLLAFFKPYAYYTILSSNSDIVTSILAVPLLAIIILAVFDRVFHPPS